MNEYNIVAEQTPVAYDKYEPANYFIVDYSVTKINFIYS